ncbi:MAG: SseB family protein [Anaerolineae bacterium]
MEAGEEHLAFDNPDLVAALQAVTAADTAETRSELYRTLLQSTLILPAPEDSAAAEVWIEEEELPLVIFEDDKGDSVLIAFTDEDAALAWEPGGLDFIGLRGLDLVLVAAQNKIDKIMLNPGSPHGQRLRRDEIVALSQGETPISASPVSPDDEAGMTVLIAPPKEAPPESWREAVGEILEHYPSIDTAYFFQLHFVPEGARHVIGLVLYEGMPESAQERLLKSVLSEFEERLPEDQALDFVVLDEPSFRETVEDTISPIYKQTR